MSAASSRVVVFSIVVHLLLQTTAAPFSTQDILEIFGNPLEDIKNTIFTQIRNREMKNEKPQKTRLEDEPDNKMIEAPPNIIMTKCTDGTKKDSHGVCRYTW